MKFKVDFTSDRMKKNVSEVEINTLEELVAYTKENFGCIILFAKENEEPNIEIYDDYRE